jgi:hypothetical protein
MNTNPIAQIQEVLKENHCLKEELEVLTKQLNEIQLNFDIKTNELNEKLVSQERIHKEKIKSIEKKYEKKLYYRKVEQKRKRLKQIRIGLNLEEINLIRNNPYFYGNHSHFFRLCLKFFGEHHSHYQEEINKELSLLNIKNKIKMN